VVGGNDPAIKTRQQSREFYAERYGGDGIVKNGGGGRCGFDGRFHLKGLGPNQLVGSDSDPAHGNGCLFLDTAIYESIWAEIISFALPYGAIRTLAVLDAGYDFEESGCIKARGLLVRAPAVRPAHFIRSVYFKEKQFNRICEDAKRVSAAVNKLVDFLPEGSDVVNDRSLSERLELGFLELAKRYARQFSAAKAKRIIHYNVTASNLSLDGAWLDLSGTRVFSQLIGGDRLDAKRFLTEYLPALESIQSMCYYLSKYLVVSVECASRIYHRAVECFKQEYEQQLSLHNAMQVGFPLVILEYLIDDPVFLGFSQCLKNIMAFDDFSVSPVSTELGWEGYECWRGRLYLELLKKKAAKNHIPNVAGLKIDPSLVGQLFAVYGRLFDLVFDKAVILGIKRKNLIYFMAINLIRRNRCHRVVFDLENIISEVREKARSVGDISLYGGVIDEALSQARLTFADDEGFRLPFWVSHSTTIQYDLLSGAFFITDSDGVSGSLGFLSSMQSHADEVDKAISFYGNYWGFVDEEV
ncbi:MAG: hypothetical protein C0410_15670, partial [Anaerolinea sp.]|nr:hypothetical protein [Anaerolinea sp.]